ncbi:hypothetical protein GUJ93_ZPchr0005g15202 [Zizania palustris]|uniref:Uncharacterized protein n=1 Tax=Zizania palustris TaxID=103762 RepID=A0A8J5W167_ZIZPA|nr:hypothetical protein GUJ93_ZPchr0005g15202 [Zizania palustris]
MKGPAEPPRLGFEAGLLAGSAGEVSGLELPVGPASALAPAGGTGLEPGAGPRRPPSAPGPALVAASGQSASLMELLEETGCLAAAAFVAGNHTVHLPPQIWA